MMPAATHSALARPTGRLVRKTVRFDLDSVAVVEFECCPCVRRRGPGVGLVGELTGDLRRDKPPSCTSAIALSANEAMPFATVLATIALMALF
mmetsp:Transcript_50277/g.144933  ORF Transcript_50277/g.144933 Transcript_50277/m.144933 type:complete len:93 (+) Transcript_50277:60-338(+)